MTVIVMKINFLSLLMALSLIPSCGNAAGIWAAAGQSPFVSSSAASVEIFAPDGMKKIKETIGGLALSGKHTIVLQDILSPPSLTEILWSPDSKSFIVNASDGGVVGTWSAYYYSINIEEKQEPKNFYNLLASKIQEFPHCDDPEVANVGAVGWLDGGKELLVVAEVPPHSSCRNMGAIRGFRVAVTSWNVLGEIPEAELWRDWGNVLGPRFTAERPPK